MSVTVTTRDLRAARLGCKDVRHWFARHGIDWREFARHGVSSDVLLATGDPQVLPVIEAARARHG